MKNGGWGMEGNIQLKEITMQQVTNQELRESKELGFEGAGVPIQVGNLLYPP